jgi:cytochrome c oxidase accessory protein FixG
MDKNSLVVAYDYVRGEGRGKFKKNEDRKEEGKGDCIDCKQCVHVCPTGIDIRNGTQLECVNCTACIDACDHIMDGVGLDRGLIRYASEENIKNKTPFIFTTRVKTYIGVLLILLVLLSFMIISREPVDATILRTRGTIFQKYDDTHFSNIFDVKILNKTRYSLDVELKVIEGPGRVEMVGGTYALKESDEFHGKMLLIIDKEDLLDQIPFTIGVYDGGKLLQEVETSFIGPNI